MMTAYIAYQRLNSKAKAEVNRLFAIPINPAAVSRQSEDFVNASHWADDLRPFAEFKFAAVQHFADFPFSADGTPVPADQPGPDNVIVALERNVEVLKTSTDDNARAQALRFIIHFVGDIHQPLHCSTRVDSAHPDGDRGGNDFFVRVPDDNGRLQKKNLHSYWDGGLGRFPKTGPNFAPPPLNSIPRPYRSPCAATPTQAPSCTSTTRRTSRAGPGRAATSRRERHTTGLRRVARRMRRTGVRAFASRAAASRGAATDSPRFSTRSSRIEPVGRELEDGLHIKLHSRSYRRDAIQVRATRSSVWPYRRGVDD